MSKTKIIRRQRICWALSIVADTTRSSLWSSERGIGWFAITSLTVDRSASARCFSPPSMISLTSSSVYDNT